MAETPITDDTARELRTAWFAYLDTIAEVRRPLHAYCVRLTRNPWDAEDLAQDALLRGFALIGRGDLHGPGSPVESPRAYLFRTATHLRIDAEGRRARESAALARGRAGARTGGRRGPAGGRGDVVRRRFAAGPADYHQPAEVLSRMIATTTLPWGGAGLKLH